MGVHLHFCIAISPRFLASACANHCSRWQSWESFQSWITQRVFCNTKHLQCGHLAPVSDEQGDWGRSGSITDWPIVTQITALLPCVVSSYGSLRVECKQCEVGANSVGPPSQILFFIGGDPPMLALLSGNKVRSQTYSDMNVCGGVRPHLNVIQWVRVRRMDGSWGAGQPRWAECTSRIASKAVKARAFSAEIQKPLISAKSLLQRQHIQLQHKVVTGNTNEQMLSFEIWGYCLINRESPSGPQVSGGPTEIITRHLWPAAWHYHVSCILGESISKCTIQWRWDEIYKRKEERKKHASAAKNIKRNFWITRHESKRLYQLPHHVSSWQAFIFRGKSIW